MSRVRVLEVNVGLMLANVFAKFSVTGVTKRKSSILVAVIEVEDVETTASFLTTLNNDSNSDLFYYSYNR